MILFVWILTILFTPGVMIPIVLYSQKLINHQDVRSGLQTFTSNASYNMDPCLSAPCLNAGTCFVSSTPPYSYTCQCVPGYTGSTCNKGLDECSGNPCVNGACVDDIGSFRCQCYPGFTGDLCDRDLDECQNSPCYNGGVCHQPAPGLYGCQCLRGYRGFRCETDIDECMALSPCQNGGLCRQGSPGTYRCTCLPGFSGSDCQDKTPECSSRPCKNGGECIEGEGFHSFRCVCGKGFSGRQCEAEEDVDACATRNNVSICGRQGHCVPSVEAGGGGGGGGYRCLCPYGVTTSNQPCRPNNLTSDPCKSDPCQNGGRCQKATQGTYRCQCPCGYDGAVCQTITKTSDNSHYSDVTCQNGGMCFEQLDGQQICLCPSNYTGEKCEMIFNQCTDGSNPCLNEGTCYHNLTDGRVGCLCLDGYTGDWCQITDSNSTVISTRGLPSIKSIIDPTLLIVMSSILGTVAILTGVSMVYVYFRRRKRPRDSCFSVPESPCRPAGSINTNRGPYNNWIFNSAVSNSDGREFLPRSEHVTLPRISLYQNTSSLRRF